MNKMLKWYWTRQLYMNMDDKKSDNVCCVLSVCCWIGGEVKWNEVNANACVRYEFISLLWKFQWNLWLKAIEIADMMRYVRWIRCVLQFSVRIYFSIENSSIIKRRRRRRLLQTAIAHETDSSHNHFSNENQLAGLNDDAYCCSSRYRHLSVTPSRSLALSQPNAFDLEFIDECKWITYKVDAGTVYIRFNVNISKHRYKVGLL